VTHAEMCRHGITALLMFFVCLECVDSQNKLEQHANKDCAKHNPIFSYVNGRPNVSAVHGTTGIAALKISWDVQQVLFAPSCADAFEVEIAQVGGGRLSWSAWSGMVGCAPTRDIPEKQSFFCHKGLGPQDCSTRLRIRVLAHNSRSQALPDRPSPHDEVTISCNLGTPISLVTNSHTSGRRNRPLSVRERQDQMLVARSRDKILYANERRRKWLESIRTTTTTRTTTSTTTTSTTASTTTTNRPTMSTIIITTTTSPKPDLEYLDPTLGDSFSYDQYGEYYDYSYHGNEKHNINDVQQNEEAQIPLACSYTPWSEWSPCSTSCGSGTKSKSRSLTHGSIQYCSYTQQTKSCFGTSCGEISDKSARARATLLLAKYSQHNVDKGYEVRSNLKNFTKEENRELYCVKFEVIHASKMCHNKPDMVSVRKHEMLCGLCTSKAVKEEEVQCRGSGANGKVTSWRMLMDPYCSGTWKKVEQIEKCDCHEMETFVFV